VKNTINAARLRAWLALHNEGMSEFARRAALGERHVYAVLIGERQLTSATADAIRRALGDDGWKWATRQSDALIPPSAAPTSTATSAP
jgi:hypothetical protein